MSRSANEQASKGGKAMPTRRFPPPWTAEVTPNCFIVCDANGQQIAYVYYGCEAGRRTAAKFAKLPELLSRRQTCEPGTYIKSSLILCAKIRAGSGGTSWRIRFAAAAPISLACSLLA